MKAARASDDGGMRELKRDARRRVRERLAAVTPAQRRDWSAAAARVLLAGAPGGCWLAFASMPEEIDTDGLVRGLLDAGRAVALPRIDEDSGNIRAYRIGGTDGLERNRWGIREPAPDPAAEVGPAELAVIVVPGLAFDRDGGRLGRGRGYYDRFLRAAGRGPLRVGFFYALQELERVPAGEADERLDQVVTEAGMIRCGVD